MSRTRRRQFIADLGRVIPATGIAATGLNWLAACGAESTGTRRALTGAVRGKVVKIRLPKLEAARQRLEPESFVRALNMGMSKLFDVSSPDAWRAICREDDSLALKTNCLAGASMSTLPSLSEAVARCLARAGIEPGRCIIWERSERELKRAGYRINRRGSGPRVFATDTDGVGYTNQLYVNGKAGSLISRIITHYATGWINLPRLKDHNLAGISGGMKNAFGLIHNPNKYHGNHCDPYIGDVMGLPPIRDRYRLTIVDAIDVQYHAGPGYNARWAAPENVILLGADPVAVDAVGHQMIRRLRQTHGLPTLEEQERPARHIRTCGSAEYDLGEHRIDRIRLLEIEA